MSPCHRYHDRREAPEDPTQVSGSGFGFGCMTRPVFNMVAAELKKQCPTIKIIFPNIGIISLF